MGYAIDPRPQTAPSVVRGKTPPDCDVDLLQEVLPQIGISLVTFCETLDSLAKGGDGVVVEALAIVHYCR